MISALAKTLSKGGAKACFVGLVCVLALNAAPVHGVQDDTAGGTARPRGRSGPRTRVEGAGFIQWNKAPLDPSKGASTYWLHVSAAGGNGALSGGFTISTTPNISGKVTALIVNGAPAGQPAASKPPAAGKPSVAKVLGTFTYNGKEYKAQIDLVGDLWKPPAKAGEKGASVRGNLRFKATETGSKTVNEAASVKQTSVTIWLK